MNIKKRKSKKQATRKLSSSVWVIEILKERKKTEVVQIAGVD